MAKRTRGSRMRNARARAKSTKGGKGPIKDRNMGKKILKS